MVVKYYQRKIGDKIFHYARTCEEKQEARELAKGFKEQGYKIRIIQDRTYFDVIWKIYTYPKEKLGKL